MSAFQRRIIVQFSNGVASESHDALAAEEPMLIRVRGHAISVTMRTPGRDEELAIGFLLSEGVIHQREDVLRVEPCDLNADGNAINVTLAPLVHVDIERLTRHVFASSSCGLCGKASIESVRTQFPPLTDELRISGRVIVTLPAKMRAAQTTFDQTGGLHAAAIFDARGDLICVREDVGRHNAVDKVIGHALMNEIKPAILLVSGRSSFEIMQKALAARIPIVAAISAPSSLAADFANESRQTLVGFLRDNRMNVYAHPQRIVFESEPTIQ